jgi:HEAT repeat protein
MKRSILVLVLLPLACHRPESRASGGQPAHDAPPPAAEGRVIDVHHPFGPGEPTLDVLLQALHDPDWRLRNLAVIWLQRHGEATDLVGPALLGALRDPQVEVRRTAAVAAANWKSIIGEQARPILREMLSSAHPLERASATESLTRLGLTSDLAPDLLAELERPDSTELTRKAAVAALATIPAAEGVVERLVSLLGHDDSFTGSAAERALVQLGPQASRALPQLLAALDDERTARRAAAVLARLGSAAGPAVPGLFGLLAGRDPLGRRQAVLALRAIRGPEPAPALP